MSLGADAVTAVKLAVPGAVIGGGNYQHTFISAKTGGIWRANDYVYINDYALGFSCDLDAYGTDHLYPRPTDHASNEWLAVSNVIGETSNATFTVSTSDDTATMNTAFESIIDNARIEADADGILDFSETNPFGEA